MDRDLEKFLGGPNKPAQERMRVTLNKVNVLTFNRNVWKQLGKPDAVYLYYSRIRDLIALEPVHSNQLPAAFPVLTKTTGFRINAAPFCRHFRIRLDRTLRFIAPDIRDGKLELKLAETVSEFDQFFLNLLPLGFEFFLLRGEFLLFFRCQVFVFSFVLEFLDLLALVDDRFDDVVA